MKPAAAIAQAAAVTAGAAPPAVALRGISKRFGPVLACDGVDLEARWGEVHAILGENGAGKSTLMSILSGLYAPDAGQIFLDGRPAVFHSPADAVRAGVGMVYQHFMLVEPFTVAENMALGTGGGFWLDTRAAERAAAELGARLGLAVDPAARVADLSVGERQRVEVLRILARGARILVFDEPTAVLTPQEGVALMATLRRLAADGCCVLLISHKLEEVRAAADRITVLRRGRVVGRPAPGAPAAEMARLMVGEDLPAGGPRRATASPGAPVLEVRGLRVATPGGRPALAGIDLQVRAGEILGIAGVSGNGQRELEEAIAGLLPVTAGQVFLLGRDVTALPPRARAVAGLAHVPEDRLGTGLAAALPLVDNAVLRAYRNPPQAAGPRLDLAACRRFAARLLERAAVRAPGLGTPTGGLSGGNQQRLLLARELDGDLPVLLIAQPTRGLDVGAAAAVQQRLADARARGAGVLLISEDLDELLALADRIAVLADGRVAGVVAAAEAEQSRLGLLMGGAA